jgi:hypothetical protein
LEEEGASAGLWVLDFEEGFGVEKVVSGEEFVEASEFAGEIGDFAAVEITEMRRH